MSVLLFFLKKKFWKKSYISYTHASNVLYLQVVWGEG